MSGVSPPYTMHALTLIACVMLPACHRGVDASRSPTVVDGGRSTLVLSVAPPSTVAFDAEARYGIFVRRGDCVLLDANGRSYAPVFGSATVRDAAFRVAEAGIGTRMELRGGPIARVTTVEGRSQASSCGAALFMVAGFDVAADAPSRAVPPPPGQR